RVEFGVYGEHLERAIGLGLRTGMRIPQTGELLTVGPYKVITDGSLNTRTAFCFDPYPEGGYGVQNLTDDELVASMSLASANGIEPAVHAIGDRANRIALDAFERVGCAGRIEHAQLLTDEDVQRFAALGVIASVQPEHAMDDRDVADALWAGRTRLAFPLAALHRAGVRLAFGSDAPVAPLDPWIAMAAAVGRTRDGREPWHPEQAIARRVALASSVRSGVAVGEPADLVVLERDPFGCSLMELRNMPVTATMLGGRFTHDTLR
ncbi:MAG: amidohydrolase family protein, partial [Actinomycetales bacterium]